MSFIDLLSLNVNEKTEKKKAGYQTLTYLSWSFAWSEFVKVYPEATYEIIKNNDGLPYFIDECGAMCYTKVTANGLTHEMWLPVMDGSNKPMRKELYKYITKAGEKTCQAINMFDINKTVMRCLVKNLAMFGLGLYIYAGEDLPEERQQTPEEIALIEAEARKKKEAIEEIDSCKKEIGNTLMSLTKHGINKKAIENSIEHHLGVKKVFDCNDIAKLKKYYLYKSGQLAKLIEEESK